jgi:ribosomal protein S12 methylthiotransferase accessory factor
MGRAVFGLRRHLVPHVVPGDAVYLLAEHGSTALRGSAVDRVVPLLDGTRDREALVADTRLAPERVDGLLSRLASAGLLVERPRAAGRSGTPAAAPEIAYWDAAGLVGDEAAQRVASSEVAVLALPEAAAVAPALRAALQASGVRVAESGPDRVPDLVLVLCADLADPALGAVAAQLAGAPWVPIRAVGARIALGPVLVPGDGPCWHCLAAQLTANRPVDTHLLSSGVPPVRPVVGLAPVHGIGVQTAVVEAVKWLAGHRHPGQRQVWTFDSLTLQSARHAVRRRPQCPGCGDPALVAQRTARPVRLPSAPVRARAGGHRPATPGGGAGPPGTAGQPGHGRGHRRVAGPAVPGRRALLPERDPHRHPDPCARRSASRAARGRAVGRG